MGKSTVTTGLLLIQKGDVKEIKLPIGKGGNITEETLKKLLKQKSESEPELLCSYPFKEGSVLVFFGYTEGKAGSENKHELPPPHDEIMAFGDILVLCCKDEEAWANPIPLKVDDYEAFYTRAFGGFDDTDEGIDAGDERGEVEADLDEDGGDDSEDEADAEADDDAAASLEDDEEEEVDDAEVDVEANVEEDLEGEAAVAARRIKSAAAAARAKPGKPKAKKSRKTTAAANAVAASLASYANYLHVEETSELRFEMSGAYDPATLPPQRTHILKILRELFKDQLNEEQSFALERAIYNGTINVATQRHIGRAWSHPPFVELYKMHARHIAANFHPESYVNNTELFQRFKEGSISIDDIASMDPYQLFEGRWKDSFVQQQVREKRQLEGNKAMATDRFLCSRCWKRECTYYEMQTRSADEPMTIFITCLNCGKHWRQ
jgi:DNA-directed RNA polymerase subunit M/transcription elongation factor TFIIS